MSDTPDTEQVQPIYRRDLETTLRVLADLDKFLHAIQNTGGLRGNLYFDSTYSSSLQPAAETVQTFGNYLLAFTPTTTPHSIQDERTTNHGTHPKR